MDPYLEEPNLWSDVHLTLIIAMRAALNAVLPTGYRAAADRYIWIHEPDADERKRVAPDVFIVESEKESARPGTAGVATPASAAVIFPAVKREGNKYLKIVEAKTHRLISVIELLSPTNKKAGPDREAYLTKRVDYLTAGVNLIEIDLLRSGQRIPIGYEFPANADYYALVCRADQMPRGDVWFFGVRDELPRIPIPLMPGIPDCILCLRDCLDRAFEEGRYDEDINYNEPAVPPLSAADAEWAKQLTRN
jgi:Protein of unknown function (DUF4058)